MAASASRSKPLSSSNASVSAAATFAAPSLAAPCASASAALCVVSHQSVACLECGHNAQCHRLWRQWPYRADLAVPEATLHFDGRGSQTVF